MNTFETKEATPVHSKSKQEVDDVGTILQNLNDTEKLKQISPLSIAFYVIRHFNNIGKFFLDP